VIPKLPELSAMSDHDRGAYTPNNDAPLSFDARQARGRRAFPTTLVISLVILVGLGVAIFMFYRSGVRGANDAPVPVGSPVGEIKGPPGAQNQQPADPGQGLQIYKAEGNAAAPATPPTTFAPPPEQPQPRPAPTTPVAAAPIAAPAASVPAPVAAAAPKAAPAPAPAPAVAVKTAPVAAVPVTPAKPAPVAAAPAPKPAVVAAAPAKPVAKPKDDVVALLDAKPAKPAAKVEAAPAPSAPASHGAAVVQFGAFSSSALAGSEWAKLAKAYPSEMAGKGRLVESVDKDGKTLFRGAVSGFSARADAVAFCAKLKADGKACIVK
jgi:cytoskeletal protein RodZ